MGAKAETPKIDTPARRRRLPLAKAPVWAAIGQARGGLKLGYRKAPRGGVWIAKVIGPELRQEAVLGPADDEGAPAQAMSFTAAAQAAIAWAERIRAAAAAGARGPKATVIDAVKDYVAARVARNARAGANAQSRLAKHVLSDKLAGMALGAVTTRALMEWRDRLDPKLAPGTVNRMFNDLRAALHRAGDLHWRTLPPTFKREIEHGLKAKPGASRARVAILPDADIRAIVAAALGTDDDLGTLVLVLASTGMRFSQVAAMTVADVQPAAQRLMVPPSRKGTGTKARARIAVPVGVDVIERLRPLIAGRRGHEPLLLRWAHKQKGPGLWERTHRAAWGLASEMLKGWNRALTSAGVAYVEPYALRHSSIVRGLTAGLPLRLVAAQHDTSAEMIERHYAAYIVDAAEELTRRAITPLTPPAVSSLHAVG
ncbi:site-specific recombinase XerD [Bosea sp. AK1]|uniref:tyrosine-type recombinase/integrase n=1 Tax=Bosea sp. AK1 TaxID=2587160 RepID=UPI0011544EBC|nr:tyrosine-type recombinase/integrase [Bosea sp. AK1]TQI75325.1 site-specific recombinase XerD [Bosea sp. AK1]